MVRSFFIAGMLFLNCTFAAQLRWTHSLKQEIHAIHTLPEARELIQKALRKGDIQVVAEYNPKEDSQAFWDGASRRIVINMPRQTSFGDTLYSILFELHNAASDDELTRIVDSARAGQIDKERYVTSIERMEHQNTILCYALYQKGIDRGLFPQEGQIPMVLTDFHDHFLMQQILGHSNWVARTYDWNCPQNSHIHFHGTVPSRLSQKEVDDILMYLSIKGNLNKPERRNVASQALEREIGQLKEAIARNGKKGALKTRADFIERIFHKAV